MGIYLMGKKIDPRVHFHFLYNDIIFSNAQFVCHCADAFDTSETPLLRQPKKFSSLY